MNYLHLTNVLWWGMYSVPMLLLFLFYYGFILIPQKQHLQKLQKITPGDTVVTQGGLTGTVVRLEQNYYIIALENHATARITKKSVVSIL